MQAYSVFLSVHKHPMIAHLSAGLWFSQEQEVAQMQNERLRTAQTLTDVGGEDALVVDLYLDPFHEQAHVLGGRQRRRPPVLVLVLPAVFVLGPAGHDGAGLVGAGVADGAVDEVDAVEEVDHVDGDPVVEVLAVGQLHGLPEVQPRVQGRLRLLVQLEALRPRLKLALGSECLVFVEDLFQGSVHDGMRRRRRRRLCLPGGFLIAVETRPSRPRVAAMGRSVLIQSVILQRENWRREVD